MKMQVGCNEYLLRKGDVICIPANTFYKPLEAEKLEYYFIHFTVDSATVNDENLHFHSNPLLPSGDFEYSFWGGSSAFVIDTLTHCAENEYVKDVFLRISSLNIRSNREKLLLDCLLRELLIYISNSFGVGVGVSGILARITDYIDQMYCGNITLAALSKKFGISKSYIARLFKNELHTTSVEYLNRVRISNACRLLLCTEKSIAQISEEVGFKEQYYFTRVFKRLYGTTPTEYKKRNTLL